MEDLIRQTGAKDAKRLKAAGLDAKAKSLVGVLSEDPFAASPSYKVLVGKLAGLCSRRVSLQHRLVYQVFREPCEANDTSYEGVAKAVCVWSH